MELDHRSVDLFMTQGCRYNANHKLQEDSYLDKGPFVAPDKVRGPLLVLPVAPCHNVSLSFLLFPRIAEKPLSVNHLSQRKKAGETQPSQFIQLRALL